MTGAGGPLAWRLLAAFVAAALSSVLVMATGAVVATDRGLAAAQETTWQQTADQVAEAAGIAYAEAAGWAGAPLERAVALAEGAGARLVGARRRGPDRAVPGRRHPARARAWPARAGTGSAHPSSSPGRRSAPCSSSSPRPRARRRAGSRGDGSASPRQSRSRWPWPRAGSSAGRSCDRSGGSRPPRGRWPAATGPPAPGCARPASSGTWAGRSTPWSPRCPGPSRRGAPSTADVAHELRTPLATLRAGLEELRDGLADPDPARLTSLHDQTLRLGRVVDDLAELAAAESAALSLRLADVDLAALARAELAAHAPRLEAAGLAAPGPSSPRVWWCGPTPTGCTRRWATSSTMRSATCARVTA